MPWKNPVLVEVTTDLNWTTLCFAIAQQFVCCSSLFQQINFLVTSYTLSNYKVEKLHLWGFKDGSILVCIMKVYLQFVKQRQGFDLFLFSSVFVSSVQS